MNESIAFLNKINI